MSKRSKLWLRDIGRVGSEYRTVKTPMELEGLLDNFALLVLQELETAISCEVRIRSKDPTGPDPLLGMTGIDCSRAHDAALEVVRRRLRRETQ